MLIVYTAFLRHCWNAFSTRTYFDLLSIASQVLLGWFLLGTPKLKITLALPITVLCKLLSPSKFHVVCHCLQFKKTLKHFL